MKQFDRFWRSLEMNRRELLGTIILLALLALTFFIEHFLTEDLADLDLPSKLEVMRYIDESEDDASFDLRYAESEHPSSPRTRKQQHQESFFSFDPNTLNKEGWVALGLSEKQAEALLKYRSKGAVFTTPEDLRSVFVLSDAWLERHLGDVEILTSAERRKEGGELELESELELEVEWGEGEPLSGVLKIELNTADSIALMNLKGVGAYSARRIISYRDALGGFHSTKQLEEVWGLHENVRAKLLEQIILDTNQIRTIAIDTCSYEELAGHPYISWQLAKHLVSFRTQHGTFLKVDAIRASHMLNDSLYERIRPYLTISD